jgi:hypothetical protein
MIASPGGCSTRAWQQGALAGELRAGTTLATLRAQRGRPDAARELIAPLLFRCSQGLDTTDLRDARRLISTPSRCPHLVSLHFARARSVKWSSFEAPGGDSIE